ncbi:NAD(P)H-dependent FMN reductase [Pedobacter westerhofensis]|uniref:NAD(P)H-dependent FMN reductase n=1 Tax=Pedobacter westerhofensis TaxID=425512 RepID=A0A521FQ38_9SPHI|nr:NAD(P)H-dependent oxidoreductase [Pedobacter westerhofensis]SMO98325.1 NAD(P)H-dependent FMN reductase [Pedobacter westerhofensis]
MVTIISGTNRPGSNTLKVAKYYQEELTKKGQEASILDMMELPENFIQTDMFGNRTEAFAKILKAMDRSEKFVFIIPEYNGSFPGVLKAFIDACDFPGSFYNKKACLVGISGGKYGNIRGIDHFVGVCGYLHMNVLPLRLHIPAIKTELNENNAFFKEDTLKFTEEQIDKFIAF